jgi:hypothetical protein
MFKLFESHNIGMKNPLLIGLLFLLVIGQAGAYYNNSWGNRSSYTFFNPAGVDVVYPEYHWELTPNYQENMFVTRCNQWNVTPSDCSSETLVASGDQCTLTFEGNWNCQIPFPVGMNITMGNRTYFVYRDNPSGEYVPGSFSSPVYLDNWTIEGFNWDLPGDLNGHNVDSYYTNATYFNGDIGSQGMGMHQWTWNGRPTVYVDGVLPSRNYSEYFAVIKKLPSWTIISYYNGTSVLQPFSNYDVTLVAGSPFVKYDIYTNIGPSDVSMRTNGYACGDAVVGYGHGISPYSVSSFGCLDAVPFNVTYSSPIQWLYARRGTIPSNLVLIWNSSMTSKAYVTNDSSLSPPIHSIGIGGLSTAAGYQNTDDIGAGHHEFYIGLLYNSTQYIYTTVNASALYLNHQYPIVASGQYNITPPAPPGPVGANITIGKPIIAINTSNWWIGHYDVANNGCTYSLFKWDGSNWIFQDLLYQAAIPSGCQQYLNLTITAAHHLNSGLYAVTGVNQSLANYDNYNNYFYYGVQGTYQVGSAGTPSVVRCAYLNKYILPSLDTDSVSSCWANSSVPSKCGNFQKFDVKTNNASVACDIGLERNGSAWAAFEYDSGTCDAGYIKNVPSVGFSAGTYKVYCAPEHISINNLSSYPTVDGTFYVSDMECKVQNTLINNGSSTSVYVRFPYNDGQCMVGVFTADDGIPRSTRQLVPGADCSRGTTVTFTGNHYINHVIQYDNVTNTSVEYDYDTTYQVYCAPYTAAPYAPTHGLYTSDYYMYDSYVVHPSVNTTTGIGQVPTYGFDMLSPIVPSAVFGANGWMSIFFTPIFFVIILVTAISAKVAIALADRGIANGHVFGGLIFFTLMLLLGFYGVLPGPVFILFIIIGGAIVAWTVSKFFSGGG